jgi:hypothetical protein
MKMANRRSIGSIMAVLPSNDLGRAHRFLLDVYGRRARPSDESKFARPQPRGAAVLFYTLANHKGWGLALQDFPIASTPARPLEGVVYGFEVAAENLAGVVRAAEERKLKFHGPLSYPTPSPIKRVPFVVDPDGNTLERSIRRDPVSDEPQGRIASLRPIEGGSEHVPVEGAEGTDSAGGAPDPFFPPVASARSCSTVSPSGDD